MKDIVQLLGPVAPWAAGALVVGSVIAVLLKAGTDFYRARTEDRRSRVEEGKIAAELLRQVLDDLRREAERLEEQLRAERRWNADAELLLEEGRRFLEDASVKTDEESPRPPGERRKLATQAADLEQRLRGLMLRAADLPRSGDS